MNIKQDNSKLGRASFTAIIISTPGEGVQKSFNSSLI